MGDQDSQAVRMVQAAMKDKGLYTGRLDGDYGPLTDNAIRRFLA